MTELDQVLALARLVPVFPCRSTTDGKRKAKSPLTANGFLDASQEGQQIKAWYDMHPGCLWGVPMGSTTRLVAIDYDPDKATQVSQDWVAAHTGELMGARQHTTARNGRHYIFRASNGDLYHSGADVTLDGQKRPGIDIRAEGGYIIWWPLTGLHHENTAPELPAGLLEGRAFHAMPAPRPPAPTSPAEWQRSRSKVMDALAHIDPQPYDQWVRTGMSIHHASGGSDDGFDLWHGWSAGGISGDLPHSYSGVEACRDKWDSFGRNRGTALALGSLFNDAKTGGYVPPRTIHPQDIHNVQMQSVRGGSFAIRGTHSGEAGELLPGVLEQAGEDAKANPQPATAEAATEGERALLRECLQTSGEPGAETLRDLRDRFGDDPDASRELRPAIGSELAMPGMPSGASQRLKRGRPRSKPDGMPPNGVQIEADGVKISYQELGLACNDKGIPHGNIANAAAVLARHPKILGNLWYDEFHDRVFSTLWGTEPAPWTEQHDTRLTVWMQSELGLIRINTALVREAVQQYARLFPHNEPREWVESLIWDKTERLGYLMADGFGSPYNEYTAAVGRCFITGMVARIMLPGCKLDAVPVLEGSQGVGKSSGLAILGGKWFAESHESVTSKDFFQALQGKLLIEISELHAFRRADIERIKGVITCQVDRYRASYGHYTHDHPRRCVFGGTTNADDWNADETGARRFWPITCTHVNREWLRMHRADLFAEALEIFRRVPLMATDFERLEAAADWWNVPSDAARDEQEMRRDVDVWEEAIAAYAAVRSELRIADILEHRFGLEAKEQDRGAQMRVAKALKALGWRCKVKWEIGSAVRFWVKKN